MGSDHVHSGLQTGGRVKEIARDRVDISNIKLYHFILFFVCILYKNNFTYLTKIMLGTQKAFSLCLRHSSGASK